jgi:general secretion pathway protein G
VIVANANRRLASRTRKGFTLMEVLVVVAILIILASLATFSFMRFREDAMIDKATLDMRTIQAACKAYNARANAWPDSLQDLVTPLDGGRPFLESGAAALIDPWGQPYQYTVQLNPLTGEEEPVIFTNGPNGPLSWPKQQ